MIGAGISIGAFGATVRERQSHRLADLDEAVTLMEAFERGLAPAPIAPAGFVAVTRYRPAESRMQLGGDFLDAVALADGRLAVLIGDVCGHGPHEAAVGTALRAGWKAIALGENVTRPTGWKPSMRRSSATVASTRTSRCARAIWTCGPASCDSSPPGIRRPWGLVYSPAPGCPPAPALGLGFGEVWAATELPWVGDPVLFYTDGLIEDPMSQGPPRRWGEDGLLTWLGQQSTTSSVDALARGLLDEAITGRDLRDDVALFLVGVAG